MATSDVQPKDAQRASALLAHFARADDVGRDGLTAIIMAAQDEGRVLQLITGVLSVVGRVVPEIHQRADTFAGLAQEFAAHDLGGAA